MVLVVVDLAQRGGPGEYRGLVDHPAQDVLEGRGPRLVVGVAP
jgi:hypothetical protein